MYRWVEHTAELELEIEAETDEAVFEHALRAFAELVAREPGGEPVRHEITLSAPDRATLLADWVEELVFLADTEGLVPRKIAELDLRPDGLRAVVEGRRGSPAPLVKAVTYHDLEYARDPEGLRARLVLDV